MEPVALPRIVVAGLSGDAGKSLVSCGLCRALTQRELRVAPFKKGPDFIDAAWLGQAAGRPGRNLDTFMMPAAAIERALGRAARGCDLAVIEGNRGLFDGLDAHGSHSTATLAELVGCPVVLVVDCTKVTRTVAALVLGCRALAPTLNLAGVVLNRVATSRQEKVIRAAIDADVGIPVLGALPRLDRQHLPSRHLGLLTAAEHPRREAVLEELAALVAAHVDLQAIVALAETTLPVAGSPPRTKTEPTVRVGILGGQAFTFYYPENLEALEDAGATLIAIDPLRDHALPEIDALYAGGGFPELYAEGLAANSELRAALRRAIDAGLPVWAECGGLMYLGEQLVVDGATHAMVGALPIALEQTARPQGHGYVLGAVDRDNPFLPRGARIAGHEFHYSRLAGPAPATVLALERGTGLGERRDGIARGNVFASYTHIHAAGLPEWAPALVRAARGERAG